MPGLVKVDDGYQIVEGEVGIPNDLGRVSVNFVTADPVHYGHMEMVRSVLGEYADTVLSPLHNYYPPGDGVSYNVKKTAPFEHRLAMLQLALQELRGEGLGNVSALLPGDYNQNPKDLFRALGELSGEYAGRMVFVIGSSSLVTDRFQQLARPSAPWGGVNNGKRLMKKIGRNRNGIYFNMSLQIILETN